MWAAMKAMSTAAPAPSKKQLAAADDDSSDDDSSDGDSSDDDGDASPVNAIPSHFSKVSLPALRLEAGAASSGGKRGRSGGAVAASAGDAAAGEVAALQRLPSVARSFPRFARVPLVAVELRAGDALFLPAGWFHEVVSLSDERAAPDASHLHMALNYWYHPASVARGTSFEQPYTDTFWRDVYARQCGSA